MTQETKENKMGTKPINSLLIKMAIPMMLSMLVQALYNVIDSIYVAQLSQDALNAVSLSFPVQNVITAIGSGTGAGVNALISKSLGAKNPTKANKYAINGLFLALCSFVVIFLFGIFGVEPFFRSQTDIDGIIDGGVSYLTICCCLSFGVFGQVLFERIMQSTGKTVLSMCSQGVGAIINIVLDPIFIFGYFGIPAMGVAGAAVATVIGQICGLITGFLLNHNFNEEISIKFKGFKPELEIIKDIYRIGFPTIITISVGSVMTYLINRLLIAIEPTATASAVFGVYFKLQSFVVMPVLGLAHAMMPIVSYNLGANNKKRMLKTYHLSILYAFVVMVFGSLMTYLFPDVLLSFFNPTDDMLAMGTEALRIISVSFLFVSVSLTSSTFFQACGRSLISMIMSLSRQLLILVPVAYVLGYTLGYEYVWFAIPIGEFGAVLIAIFARMRLEKTLFSKMPEVSE